MSDRIIVATSDLKALRRMARDLRGIDYAALDEAKATEGVRYADTAPVIPPVPAEVSDATSTPIFGKLLVQWPAVAGGAQ